MKKLLTTTEFACEATKRTRKPIHPWTVRRAVDRGDVTYVTRVGTMRLFDSGDLDRIVKQLGAHGYLDKAAVA